MVEEWSRWENALHSHVEKWELERAQVTAERKDAFSHGISFGTGGIRALMGIGPNRLNRLTVAQASAGLAAYLLSSCAHRPKVVIAYDTRYHSKDFANVAAGTFAAAGVQALLFRTPCSTPQLSFAVPRLAADAGVVITASHNPMEYNGYKVYGPTGDQATDELVAAVHAEICKISPFSVAIDALDDCVQRNDVRWIDDSIEQEYVHAVLEQSSKVDCSNIQVVYSPLNGCGLKPSLAVLESCGVRHTVVKEQAEPDGSFATCPKPNPEHREAMARAMDQALAEGAHLALANDPDADRIGVAVLHNGDMRMLTGDEIGLLLLDFLCHVQELPPNPVAITTIVSSPLLDAVAREAGVELRRTLTGFKYIGEQINALEEEGRAGDFVVGVEESCGYLRGAYVRDKDGVLALMLVCEMAAWHLRQGNDLVEALEAIYKRCGYVVSRQVSVEIEGVGGHLSTAALVERIRRNPPSSIGGLHVRAITDYLSGAPMPGDFSQILPKANVVQLDLVDDCRLIVRPSGTEPKVKAYCFAQGLTEKQANERLARMEVDARKLAYG